MFVNILNGLEDKKILPEKVPLNAPFVEKKKKKKKTLVRRYIVLVDHLKHYKLI